MSEENIGNITKSESNFPLTFADHHVLPDINFNVHSLLNNIISIPKKVINKYISHTLNPWLRNLNTDFTLTDCFVGSVKLTKNANSDKYRYSGYSIGFDSRSEFFFTGGRMGRNVIRFGADITSSVHVHNKNKEILTLGEESIQGL